MHSITLSCYDTATHKLVQVGVFPTIFSCQGPFQNSIEILLMKSYPFQFYGLLFHAFNEIVTAGVSGVACNLS